MKSWKGDDQKSGGVATNIGVHFLICCILYLEKLIFRGSTKMIKPLQVFLNIIERT